MIYPKMLEEQTKIKQELLSIDQQLSVLPSGKLVCTKVEQNSGIYYKWYQSDDHHKRYISKQNLNLAQELAKKKYLSYLKEELTQEFHAINQYLTYHNLVSTRSQSLLCEHPEFSKLLSPFFKPLSEQLSDWQDEPYTKNPNYPEHLIHQGAANHLLRSKSEAIIDLLLYTNKIPYRYECELLLGDTVVYPDFTIMHPHTRKIYYWEHFGMMDDPLYSKNAYGKLQLYSTHEIYPSIHLITTFETKKNPLSIEYVTQMIQHYFL